MGEQQPVTESQVPNGEDERKPVVFAVRIDPTFRDQIEGLRGITGQSVNEVGVEALNDWVAKTIADDTVRERAMADIDAEARRLEERRAAIAGILGQSATAQPDPENSGSPRPSGKQSKLAPDSRKG
jgi:hypothetical protein